MSVSTFNHDQLNEVEIPRSILVAGYQADTSNSIETNAELGESPIRLAKHKTEHPSRWKQLPITIGEITGEEPTRIPMVRLRLQTG